MMTTVATPKDWMLACEDKTFIYSLGEGGTNRFWAHVQAAGPEKISKEEQIAVARLMVSAPELLAALRDVISWVPGATAWHTDAPLKAVENARAAIAKATGAA